MATKAHFFEKTYFFYNLKMDQIGDNNDDRNRLDEIALKEAIIGLDDREKNILKLRFFKGKTQAGVAQKIEISQAQVSRIEKGAPGKIKKALQQKRVNLRRLTRFSFFALLQFVFLVDKKIALYYN